MSADCIFCKIIEGTIPSTKVFENEKIIAFKDLHPQAAIHCLFIHRGHTKDINDMMVKHPEQAAEVLRAITEYTKREKLDHHGFRVVTNLGPYSGQTVFHTHFHLLAGEPLGHFGA